MNFETECISIYSLMSKANECLFIAEHEFGEGFRELGLTDARRPEKDKTADGSCASI
jgi:hypothetical protein